MEIFYSIITGKSKDKIIQIIYIISLRFRHGGEKNNEFVLRSRQDKFMGRKRKDFSDKFKIEVAKEALKKRAKETEVAAKYNIAPSTLSEWMELFLDGKLETEEQKALREENEKLRAKQDEMLASLGKKQLEVDLLKKKLHLD